MASIKIEDNEDHKIWSRDDHNLLITTRLNMEDEFSHGRNKKSVLWDSVLLEMKKFNRRLRFDRNEIQKKWENLKVTYRRIKLRNRDRDRDVTSWEYFELFDSVYGTTFNSQYSHKMLTSSIPEELVKIDYYDIEESPPAPCPILPQAQQSTVNKDLRVWSKKRENFEYSEETNETPVFEPTTNSSPTFIKPPVKKPKKSRRHSHEKKLFSLACDYLKKDDENLDIARVWSSKLKCLHPDQKLFAEKAINDILFEAQLGTLNRNSVKVNYGGHHYRKDS